MGKRKNNSKNSKLAAKANRERIRAMTAVAIVVILISLGLFTAIKPEITGFFTKETLATYNQSLNITATSTQTHAWAPENRGELRSVSLSGKLLGTGTARVYLEKDGLRYLILDNEQFEQQTPGITSITGLVVENKTKKETDKDNTTLANITNPAEDVIENTTTPILENAMPPAENITIPAENATIPDENTTLPEEGITENITASEKAIGISLKYNAETPYDSDNDGTELTTSAIDFTVENTSFNWNANAENLCTQWIIQPDDSDTATSICYGSSECCALLEVAPGGSNWNEPLTISMGLYGTAANNTVSGRVIFANYSLEGEIYSDITYSEFGSLRAEFVEPTPEEATAIEFSDICEDTCALLGFNDSSYTLVIEVENATLEISKVAYTIATIEETDSKPPVVTIFSPQIRVYNTAIIDLNFSIDEPVTDIWYVLNEGGNSAITTNTTITVLNGSNNLTLYATDLAGNTGSDGVAFSVRLTEINASAIANITNITANLSAKEITIPGNLTCKQFQDDILWTSGFSLAPEGSTEYQTWNLGNNCTTAGGTNCIIQNVSVKTRLLYSSYDELNATKEGQIQISAPDESICDNPANGIYSKYIAYETLTQTKGQKKGWDCGEKKNSDKKCGIGAVYDYSANASCYGIKSYASQNSIIDAFTVNYTLCWAEPAENYGEEMKNEQ